jgi:hypothetical protein
MLTVHGLFVSVGVKGGSPLAGSIGLTALGRQGPHGRRRRGRRHRRDERQDSLQTVVGGYGWAWRRVPGRWAVAAAIRVDGPSPIVKISPSISLTTLMRAP